jgi:hypothetical protein
MAEDEASGAGVPEGKRSTERGLDRGVEEPVDRSTD